MDLTKIALAITVLLLGLAGYLAIDNKSKLDRLQSETQNRRSTEEETAKAAAEAAAAAAMAQEPKVEELEGQLQALAAELDNERAENAALAKDLEAKEQENAVIADAASDKEATEATPMTPLQKKVTAAAMIGKVVDVKPEYGFVVVNAGSGNNLREEQEFALRRGTYIVGRIRVSSVEDVASSIANIVQGSVPTGMEVLPGDEVIDPIF